MKFFDDYLEQWEKPLPKKEEHVGEESFIEWQDYNYPFFAPLILYDKTKAMPDRRSFVSLLEFSFILAILFYILFIAASGLDMIKNKHNNLVFFIAIFNAFFAVPFALFIFYKGY